MFCWPNPVQKRSVLLLAPEGTSNGRMDLDGNLNSGTGRLLRFASPPPPPTAAPAPAPAAAMSESDAAADLRRRMMELRAAIQRRMADSRDRAAATSSAFNAALLEARSIADQTVSNRAKLSKQKQHLRKLESDLAQALSVQTGRRSNHKLMTESISNTTATNEQLRRLVMDRRATRDECMNAISNQLNDIESLEAEGDTDENKNLENALIWYDKFVGFRVVGGEGVKFVFNKIDVQSPDKEYSFCLKLVEERYILVRCVPFVDGTEELVKDLNCNNDLYKFVRVMRNRFQAATISGNLLSSSFCLDITSSSFSALSLDSRSENSIDRSHTQGTLLKLPSNVWPRDIANSSVGCGWAN